MYASEDIAKVIRLSLWLMWLSSILLACGLVILRLVDLQKDSYYYKILLILLVPMGVGFAGFQANIIQFGVDQLHDTSSSEIKTFIIWYSWAFYTSTSVVISIIVYTKNVGILYVSLLVCTNLTLALSLKLLLQAIMIMEPKTQNPFKLIYNILVCY